MRWTQDEYNAWMQRRAQMGSTLQRAEPSDSKDAPSEAVFLAWVRSEAKAWGWLTYHTRDSRGSDAGFPDLVLARPGCPLVLAELKTSTGKLTEEQMVWMSILQHTPGVTAVVWRPADKPTITALLRASTPTDP